MLKLVLEKLNIIISPMKESNQFSDGDKRVMREHILYAINSTRAHIEGSKKKESREISTFLSSLWLRTAKQISHINNPKVHSLRRLLETKGRYWTEPNSYTREEILEAKIGLDQIEELLNGLCNDVS